MLPHSNRSIDSSEIWVEQGSRGTREEKTRRLGACQYTDKPALTRPRPRRRGYRDNATTIPSNSKK